MGYGKTGNKWHAYIYICTHTHNTATVPKIFCPAFQTLAVFRAKLKPRIVSSVSTREGSSSRTQYAVTYSASGCGRYRGTWICRRCATRLSGRHWDGALRLTLSPLIESAVQVRAWDWINYSIINFDVFVCVIKILYDVSAVCFTLLFMRYFIILVSY